MSSWNECHTCGSGYSADKSSTKAPVSAACGHTLCRECANTREECPVCNVSDAFSCDMNANEALCNAILFMANDEVTGPRQKKRREGSNAKGTPPVKQEPSNEEEEDVVESKVAAISADVKEEYATEACVEAQVQDSTTQLSSDVLKVLEKYKIPVTEYGKGIACVSKSVKKYPVAFRDLFPLLDFMLPTDDDAPNHVQLIFTDHKKDPRNERPGISSRTFLRKLKAKKSRNEIEEAAVGWHQPRKDWNPKEQKVLTAMLTVLHNHYEADLAKSP